MALRFGLETVLKHRKRLEEIAQRELVEAQEAVDEVLARLESMYQRSDEIRLEIAEIENGERSDKMEFIRSLESFLQGHKVRTEAVRLEARERLKVAEDRQQDLIIAAQEKKSLVKLKEKRIREYKEWLDRIEAKNRDDQTMMRQAWRKR